MSLDPTLGEDFAREHAAPTIMDKLDAAPQALTSTMKDKLKHLVAKIEKLEEEKAEVAAEIKDVYGEAKSLGYDTTALRKVIALRKMDADKRTELENMLDLYRHALGDI